MYQVKLLSRKDRGSMLGAPNWIKNNSPKYNGEDSFTSLGASEHSHITISSGTGSHVTDRWSPDSSQSLPGYMISPRQRNNARSYSQITPGTQGRTNSPKLGGAGTPASIKRHKAKLVAQFKPKVLRPITTNLREDRMQNTIKAWDAIRARRQTMIDLEKNPLYHPNYQQYKFIGNRHPNTPNWKFHRGMYLPPNSLARSYDHFGNKYEITFQDYVNRHREYEGERGPIERPVDFQTPPRTPRSPKVTWSDGDSVIPEWKTPVSETTRLLREIKTPESFDSRGYNNILMSPMATTSQLHRDEVEKQVNMMPTRTRYGLFDDDSILTTPHSSYGTPHTFSYSPAAYTEYKHYPASVAAHVRDNRPKISKKRQQAYKSLTKNLNFNKEDDNIFDKYQRGFNL